MNSTRLTAPNGLALLGAAVLAVLLLSSCLSFGSQVPWAYENNFTEAEVKTTLASLGEAGGFQPAVGSLDGYRNGFVSVMEVDRPETENGNRADWREIMMFRESGPVYFDAMGGGVRYHIPLVDAVSYRARSNEYRTPERTHLGIIHVTVGADSGHQVENYREAVTMDDAGMTDRVADVLRYDQATSQIVYGPPRAQTLYHPGLSRFPRSVDDYFDDPADTLTTLATMTYRYGSEEQRGAGITGLTEVNLTTIRDERQVIERQGFAVSQRTVYEAYSTGNHNVYIALVLDGTGVLSVGGQSVAGNSGVVGLAFIVFDSEDDLLAAVEGAADEEGFDVVTGLNDAGFNRDGVAADGRTFDGRITAEGREGMGTTVYPDGRRVTGAYEADAIRGYAYERLADGTAIYGYRDGEAKSGEYVVVEPQSEPAVVTYEENREVSRARYDSPVGDSEWIWVGGLTGDGSVQAMRRDGSSWLRRVDDETYEIRGASGVVYTGPLAAGEPVEATIDYPDGRSYTGTVEDWVPNGEGTMIFADGTRLSGEFENGRPNGEMVFVDGESLTTLRYFDGRLVDEDTGPDEEELASSLKQFIEGSTEQYYEYVRAVRERRAEQRAQTFAAIADASFEVLDYSLNALKAYNDQLDRQQEMLSAATAPDFGTSFASLPAEDPAPAAGGGPSAVDVPAEAAQVTPLAEPNDSRRDPVVLYGNREEQYGSFHEGDGVDYIGMYAYQGATYRFTFAPADRSVVESQGWTYPPGDLTFSIRVTDESGGRLPGGGSGPRVGWTYEHEAEDQFIIMEVRSTGDPGYYVYGNTETGAPGFAGPDDDGASGSR